MAEERSSTVARDAALLRAADLLLGVDFAPPRERAAAGGDRGTSPPTLRTAAPASEAPRAAPPRPKSAPEPRAPAPPAPVAAIAPVRDAERQRRLDALREEHDARCPHCTTATAHRRTVFGEGDAAAALMFIGEAPGETEDALGRPFVGRAGQKLDEIIAAMGLARGDVYIANVLKSRPPDNRTPLQHEVDACGPYLKRQIQIIRPRAIVTLGGPATKLVLNVEKGITRMRGAWAEYRDGELVIPVMPTFHPAYLLRNYTLETRRQVWSDMQAVAAKLRERAATLT
ncbi:MAG: uracil-DNA glycosylase [Phycisphaerales bacterium]